MIQQIISKRFLIVLIFIQIIILFFLGTNLVLQPRVQIKPTQQAIPNSTNWKTYLNNTIGYGLQYPPQMLPPQYENDSFILYDSPEEERRISDIRRKGIEIGYSLDGLELGVVVIGKTPTRQTAESAAKESVGTSLPEIINITNIRAFKKSSSNFTEIFIDAPNDQIVRVWSKYGKEKYKKIFDQILSTFQFLDQTPVNSANGSELKDIKYTLPEGWEVKLNEDNLFFKTKLGGYIAIEMYDYSEKKDLKSYFCELTKRCNETPNFLSQQIGNIQAFEVDNQDVGPKYFGPKGNKFYIISIMDVNYFTTTLFDSQLESLLNSLIF